VDDDPQILDMLLEFLEGQGYAVTAATAGDQALELLMQQEFALALLDLMLPGASGLELLSHIKSHNPDTEVILFTGHAGLDSAVQALRLGAYDYLVKSDLRLAELQVLVTKALERRRLARENRELVAHLSSAREELAHRRARELAQVRQIGETLVGPLAWDQLFQGLVNLIWDSLPVQLLGLALRGPVSELPLEACRRQPEVADTDFQAFQEILHEQFTTCQETPEPSPARKPAPEMLWLTVTVEDVTLVAGIGRQEPFSPEEAELFRIFILQSEAGIKNLVLFEHVKNLATKDALTGLHNYRYFREALRQEVERARRYTTPLSLLFLDIDDFKQINDTLGHQYGDAIIREVGMILKGGIRLADLLCRYGGDEFVLLMSQTPLEQALLLAERLRRLIARTPITQAGQSSQLTVSIGVAGLAAGMSLDDLIKAADGALYRAKEAGKNRCCAAKLSTFSEETDPPPPPRRFFN
jgi:two-component system, cell cycle response regulator